MSITKDQVAAVLRHVYTAAGAGTVVAVAFGVMSQTDADHAIELLKKAGESMGVVIGCIAALVPIINAMRAGRSASPSEQVRKVEENVPGVIVVPTNDAGAELLKRATGIEKPVETGAST